MNPNKLYKDIVYLLYNILDNEKLKYELFKDKNYRELFIELINDLFTLEKDDDAKLDDDTWGREFGNAIVIIAQAKQRFEVFHDKSVEKIYEDYSKLIAYSMNSFEIKRADLTKDDLKFTKADLLYNGRLSEDTIKKYDDLAKQDMEAKATPDEEAFVNDEDKKARPEDNQQANMGGGFNPFAQGPNGQQFMGAMPQNPMQDPRFYPYDRRPRYMPWLKIALGIVAIITAILLIAASAWAMSKSIDLNNHGMSKNASAFLGLKISSAYFDAIKQVDSKTAITANSVLGQTGDYFGSMGINQSQGSKAMNVIIFIFYCIPAIYVGYACFRKPRSLGDKYRISYWPIIFMVVFYALSIIDTYQDASVHQLRNLWSNSMSNYVDNFDSNKFNGWFDFWVGKDNLNGVTAFMDVSLAFLAASVVFGIVICFFNPKIDKMKYQKAMNEYQRAVMSAMQGVPYQMDPSLFEDDDNVIIHNKSKFTLWWEKVWDKIAFWKHKKNNKKDK